MGAYLKFNLKNILSFNFIGFCTLVTNSQNRRGKKENKTLGNNIILFTKPCLISTLLYGTLTILIINGLNG